MSFSEFISYIHGVLVWALSRWRSITTAATQMERCFSAPPNEAYLNPFMDFPFRQNVPYKMAFPLSLDALQKYFTSNFCGFREWK